MSIKAIKLKSYIKSGLKLQIICYALGSLLMGSACFFLLSGIGQLILIRYLEPGWNNREIHAAAAEFQVYINDNGIDSGQWAEISDWDGGGVYVLSARQGERHGDQVRGEPYKAEDDKEGPHSDGIQTTLPITYTDGVFQTRFLYVPSKAGMFFTMLVCALISFAVFFLVFYILLKQKLDYIRSIESGISILESGDLGYRIDVKGEDELGRLAVSVNCMSESLSNKIESEQRALQSGREIIGDLSHDIRTPLTILSGYVPLLLESEPLTARQREYLELIRKKTEQMSHRVTELLDYAVIYSGQQTLRKITLEVNTLVRHLSEELTPLGATITDTTPPGACIDADPALLERVFDNILSNLHKYADLEHEIRLICQITDGNLLMEVENTILPMAPADGKSLGLKITAYIMESHGGSLTTIQEGGSFRTTLRFPLRIEEPI